MVHRRVTQRAVEKLNSAHDNREVFFRNKVSALMVKQNVLKVMANSTKKTTEPPKPSVVGKPVVVEAPREQAAVLYVPL
jgi:hypothetical protein